MSSSHKQTPWALALILALLSLSCGQELESEAPQETATVATKQLKLTFTEELRLSGDDEASNWADSNLHISVDGSGNMLISDPETDTVSMFDPSGAFIKHISEKGDAPGQYADLIGYYVLEDGSALAFDAINGYGRIQYFDKDHTYLKDSGAPQVSAIISNLIPAPNGAYHSADFASLDQTNGLMTFQNGILDGNLKPVKTLFAAVRPAPNPNQFGDPNYWADYLSKTFRLRFHGYGISAFDNEGHAYTALTHTYKITKWSKDLKQEVRVFQKDYEPIPLTEARIQELIEQQRIEMKKSFPPSLQEVINSEVISKAIKLAEPPTHQMPIFGLLPMPEGRLLVVHDFDPISGRAVADIFDSEGALAGQVEMNDFAFLGKDLVPRMVFDKDRAYTLESKDSKTQAVRYRYTWSEGN